MFVLERIQPGRWTIFFLVQIRIINVVGFTNAALYVNIIILCLLNVTLKSYKTDKLVAYRALTNYKYDINYDIMLRVHACI